MSFTIIDRPSIILKRRLRDTQEEPPAAQTSSQPSTDALTCSQVQDMISSAVAPYQAHIRSLEEGLVKAVDRISVLESSHLELSRPKHSRDTQTQTDQQQGASAEPEEEEEEAQMEEEDEVADLLCPLPVSQPRSPSVAGDTSVLSDAATVGFSSPARPLSPHRPRAGQFSFLDHAGKPPQVPLSPPRPASSDMPLTELPVPFPINPFLYSASKPALPAADPLAHSSPLGGGQGESHVGPARSGKGPRSPSRMMNRVPRSPKSKGHHGRMGVGRFGDLDVDEAVDVVGSDSQWSSWL